MKLYVGNLVYNMIESEVKDLFSEFGKVKNVRIITDHYTRQSKGIAYVKMAKRVEGHKAMEELNGKNVNGRPLIVNEAKDREIHERRPI